MFGEADMWLLGIFWAHVDDGDSARAEGLTLDKALEWGRARAGRVLIRLGEGGYWSAGAEPVPDVEPWSADMHPPIVRRRPESERWKDRTPDDAAIRWTVEVSLTPVMEQHGRIFRDRAGLDSDVGAIVAAAKPDSWTAQEVDEFVAAIDKARAEAGDPDQFTWHAPVPRWILTFTCAAATRELAADAVKRRLFPLPDGWAVFTHAAPAD